MDCSFFFLIEPHECIEANNGISSLKLDELMRLVTLQSFALVAGAINLKDRLDIFSRSGNLTTCSYEMGEKWN